MLIMIGLQCAGDVLLYKDVLIHD